MASTLWTGKIPLFLTLCLAFRNHVFSWAVLVVRVISRPLVGDEKPEIKGLGPLDTQLAGASIAYSCVIEPQGEQLISAGQTGLVELLANGTAIKSPQQDSQKELHILNLAKEADIYRRIGPHRRLVRMLDHSKKGLVLEYMRNGDLKAYLKSHGPIPMSLKLKWAYQVAEAVDLLHKNGIIHCDIKPRNLLLDMSYDIKIIDFSGSSLDGSEPSCIESTRFLRPRHQGDSQTVATDLFALGSTLFEIFQGTSPFEEIPSDEVRRLYKQQVFPEISDSNLWGQIIKQCCYLKLIQRQMYRLLFGTSFLTRSTSTVSLLTMIETFLPERRTSH